MRGLRVPKKRRALPGKEQRKTEITTPKASKRVVRIAEGVTVGDLARNMGVKAGEIIKKLMGLGVMSTLNQVLDVDTATLVANEFGYSVENVAFDVESAIEEGTEEAAAAKLAPAAAGGHRDGSRRPRQDLAARRDPPYQRDRGGVRRNHPAYRRLHGRRRDGRKITFVDTPGHEAFTAMRARGAKVTDIVVLVVAADEGVMPQTVEAINHARAAKVPIIVAINKIDRPEANVDRVKQQLTEHGLIPEDYGGDTIAVPVSARTREGIERLLEMILLQADLMDLKAEPQSPRARHGGRIATRSRPRPGGHGPDPGRHAASGRRVRVRHLVRARARDARPSRRAPDRGRSLDAGRDLRSLRACRSRGPRSPRWPRSPRPARSPSSAAPSSARASCTRPAASRSKT